MISRIREHSRSIDQSKNILQSDFHCRFIVLEGTASSLIGTVEAALIRHYSPLWNTKLNGFGNHDPGKGRYNQAKSDWDVIHPGRIWADKCLGESTNSNLIEQGIIEYLSTKKKQ